MSKMAQDYVLDLGKRVTRHQGHLLLALACYHQSSRETYWPSHRTLAAKLSTDERQVRRIVAELKAQGVLAYERGIGAGNLCEYRFPELENRTQQPSFASEKTGQKEDKKEDNSTLAIRNIQSQNLTSTKPPNPLSESKPTCEKHPDSGLTNWGTCWTCYAEKHSGPRKEPQSVSA